MKKIYKILFTIITIISLSNIVYAKDLQYGELRYEITELDITDNNIVFKGWAIIGRTQNGRNQNGNDTNQEIRITANFGSDPVSVTQRGDNSSGDWNFFYENYWRSWDDNCNKDCQVEKVYTGQGYTYGGKTWDNKCNANDYHSQCYYENIGFTIRFDISEWGITNDQDVTFTIAARNDSYNKWTSEEPLAITSPVAKIANSSKNIIINRQSSTNELKALAEDAMYRTYDGNLVSCDDVYCIINPDSTYTISDISNNYYPSTANRYPSNTIGSGMYAIKVKNESSTCPGMPKKSDGSDTKGCLMPGNDTSYYVYSSWMKAGGQFSLNIKGYKKCSPTSPNNNKLSCNKSKTYNSECDHLTIYDDKYRIENNKFYDFRADITFNQKITISSVLTPNTTYSGGGLKFNVIYNNKISWDYYDDGNISCTVINNAGEIIDQCNNDKLNEIIEIKLNDKLKKNDEFEKNLNITAKFPNETNNINLIRQCNYDNDGKKIKNKKSNTICVFTLPKAEMDTYSGKIKRYIEDSSLLNVNNKFYTGINDIGKYTITANISGLSRFKENVSRNDSKSGSWIGNLSDSFSNCEITLIPYLYTEKGKYRFIYRPIDLNNPFPNRNAGFNWYDWINKDSNKERLKNSYSVLQYSINLDNQSINSIKDYNDSHNYLKWDFDDDESEFINKNSSLFNVLRKNVGDNS